MIGYRKKKSLATSDRPVFDEIMLAIIDNTMIIITCQIKLNRIYKCFMHSQVQSKPLRTKGKQPDNLINAITTTFVPDNTTHTTTTISTPDIQPTTQSTVSLGIEEDYHMSGPSSSSQIRSRETPNVNTPVTENQQQSIPLQPVTQPLGSEKTLQEREAES